jgi:hypothetical protein
VSFFAFVLLLERTPLYSYSQPSRSEAMSQCPFCKKTVYFAERQMGPDGKDWHKACVIKHIQTKGREGSVFESYPQDKKPAVADANAATSPRKCACGAVRDPGAKFCPSCGAKLPV